MATGILAYIRDNVVLPKLRASQVLAVYDSERRYHELCLSLASERRRVVDASTGSILNRELALETLQQMGRADSPVDELLVYVPVRAPRDDEERQRDPFALYAACGDLFPNPAHDGDAYVSLCLKAKPDHVADIQRIFAANPNPGFAVIDAVGGGSGWPQLQALLHAESARDLIFNLLNPTASKSGLKGEDTWAAEARDLLETVLGLKLVATTRTLPSIEDRVWRYLLFSEFVFDLPVSLPDALSSMPHAAAPARALVEELCERLRSDIRTRVEYAKRAVQIEDDLKLPAACAAIDDLGRRDTFPFEERSFFAKALAAVRSSNVAGARELLEWRGNSIWAGRDEYAAQWHLLEAAADLLEACAQAEPSLADARKSQDALLELYVTQLHMVDRRQREFERLVAEPVEWQEMVEQVTAQCRSAYRGFAEKLQSFFIRHLESTGWPPAGRLANADTFDHVVAPLLKESGRKVALFLIDALRYELGADLKQHLAGAGEVILQPAFASLPSVTPVGMASLLPGAAAALRLARKEKGFEVLLGKDAVPTVDRRLDLLRTRYGQRFDAKRLDRFAKGSDIQVGPAVELLLLRSNEMDDEFESNADTALATIMRLFQQVGIALKRLRELGFDEVVILTDHGFLLNTGLAAGDVCKAPPGNWITVHGRLLLGDGAADASNFVVPAEHVGVRGDFGQVAGPRTLVAYQAGLTYLHGGASMQECVVPVLTLRLPAAEPPATANPTVRIVYKRGGKRITSRTPVFEVSVEPGLFHQTTLELLVEAQDKKGAVVGEATPGGAVNLSTGYLSVDPETVQQVALRMVEDFEGKFTVRVSDPHTLRELARVELETDYPV